MPNHLWEVLGSPINARLGSKGENGITKKLARLGCEAIASFERERRRCRGNLGDAHVWAAARVCNGGHLSDDSFGAFRNWVILQGKSFYERVLSDPDSSLSEVNNIAPEDWRNEYLDWVASDAIRELGWNPGNFDFGQEIQPDEEALYSWQSLGPEELAVRLPKIWSRYGGSSKSADLPAFSVDSELPQKVRFPTGEVAGVGETIKVSGYGRGVVSGVQQFGNVVLADVKFDSHTATFIVEAAPPSDSD